MARRQNATLSRVGHRQLHQVGPQPPIRRLIAIEQDAIELLKETVAILQAIGGGALAIGRQHRQALVAKHGAELAVGKVAIDGRRGVVQQKDALRAAFAHPRRVLHLQARHHLFGHLANRESVKDGTALLAQSRNQLGLPGLRLRLARVDPVSDRDVQLLGAIDLLLHEGVVGSAERKHGELRAVHRRAQRLRVDGGVQVEVGAHVEVRHRQFAQQRFAVIAKIRRRRRDKHAHTGAPHTLQDVLQILRRLHHQLAEFG